MPCEDWEDRGVDSLLVGSVISFVNKYEMT